MYNFLVAAMVLPTSLTSWYSGFTLIIIIQNFSIIYELIEFVSDFASGKLKPTIKENFIGKAEVLQIFKVSKIGAIAGCRIIEGSVSKNAKVKVTRNEKIIFDGDILSLKREKNEANEVKSGTECGISIKEFNDFEVGDFIEAFSIEEVAQTLWSLKEKLKRQVDHIRFLK